MAKRLDPADLLEAFDKYLLENIDESQIGEYEIKTANGYEDYDLYVSVTGYDDMPTIDVHVLRAGTVFYFRVEVSFPDIKMKKDGKSLEQIFKDWQCAAYVADAFNEMEFDAEMAIPSWKYDYEMGMFP